MGKYLRYVAWISANLLVVIFVPWIVPMGSRASVHYAGAPTTPRVLQSQRHRIQWKVI